MLFSRCTVLPNLWSIAPVFDGSRSCQVAGLEVGVVLGRFRRRHLLRSQRELADCLGLRHLRSGYGFLRGRALRISSLANVPRDCDSRHAPLGDKGCHDEKVV